jgi:hypothetical protein
VRRRRRRRSSLPFERPGQRITQAVQPQIWGPAAAAQPNPAESYPSSLPFARKRDGTACGLAK